MCMKVVAVAAVPVGAGGVLDGPGLCVVTPLTDAHETCYQLTLHSTNNREI